MGNSVILLDSISERNGAVNIVSSQSGGQTTPINKDGWSGSAKLYPTGIYKGPTSLNAWLKIVQAGDYDDALTGVIPVPTKARYSSANVGNGTVQLKTYGTWPSLTHGGIRMILTRNSGGYWDVDYYSGVSPTSLIEYATDGSDDYIYAPSGNNYFRLITTDGAVDWATGDKIYFYCYQVQCKISTDGGATYGSAFDLHTGTTTWCGYDFEIEIGSGLSVRFVLEDQSQPAYTGDVLKISAYYQYGSDQLVNQSRLQKWKTRRGGYQCRFTDAGSNQSADTLAVLDRVGAISMYYTTSASLIGSCSGTATGVPGATMTVSYTGTTFNSGIVDGRLWFTTGDAMGQYYNVDAATATTIELDSDPTADGAVDGDQFVILPLEDATQVTFNIATSGDDVKYFSSVSARGWWVMLYSATASALESSLIRFGEKIQPDFPCNQIDGWELSLNDSVTRSITGDKYSRPVGYIDEVYPVSYDQLTITERDEILNEIREFNNPDYARYMLFVPTTANPNEFYYGRISQLSNPITFGRNYATMRWRLELNPNA